MPVAEGLGELWTMTIIMSRRLKNSRECFLMDVSFFTFLHILVLLP
jgi:hypothetical protein